MTATKKTPFLKELQEYLQGGTRTITKLGFCSFFLGIISSLYLLSWVLKYSPAFSILSLYLMNAFFCSAVPASLHPLILANTLI
jgi:hypothetical protein